MGLYLIINPGSTSTKIGVFQGERKVFVRTIRHNQEDLANYSSVVDQKAFRAQLIEETLRKENVLQEQLAAVIAIGGLIRPGKAGVYKVNESMCRDLEKHRYDDHAANLGALIASDFGRRLGIGAYAADAITADEMAEVARFSGIPEIQRSGRSHTLNQKYTARMAAFALGKVYEEAKLVVVHLGGEFP